MANIKTRYFQKAINGFQDQNKPNSFLKVE